jgi:hypothetical protein
MRCIKVVASPKVKNYVNDNDINSALLRVPLRKVASSLRRPFSALPHAIANTAIGSMGVSTGRRRTSDRAATDALTAEWLSGRARA